MRRVDLDKLQQPYADPTPAPERFGKAIGVVLPALQNLQDEIFGDLDDTNYGVGWWSPHPGTSRRILISDHLLMCVASLETNVVEARLHLMELADVDEQEDALVAHAVTHNASGTAMFNAPRRDKPADDAPPRLAALHTAGFFRAIGSALDCLGAAIIGVLALPTSILVADMKRSSAALEKIKNPTSDGERLQVEFREQLVACVAAAGPLGWLDWSVDYRNMLVHRGRRMQTALVQRRGATLVAPDGRAIMLARVIRQLAREPGSSEVEVLASAGSTLVMTEDANTTMEGVLNSTLHLSDRVAGILVDVWKRRRAQPELLVQPREQWPTRRTVATPGFAGYKPGSLPFNISSLHAHDAFARRFEAAALDDRVRKKWETFD